MGQRPNNAALMNAQIKFKTAECALGMGQKSNYAVTMDALIKSSKEECVSGMERR